MKLDVCGYLEEALGRRACSEALAATTLAVYSLWFGPWGAVSLVCLCGLCVSAARLLESAVLQELMKRHGQPTVGGGNAQKYACYTALALLVLLLVQVLVSPATPWLVASRWYLLLVTPLLGATLHFIGTSRAELNEALAETQTNYAQGAAWGFFLGYLMINFGQGHATVGANEPSFAQRMADYLTSNDVEEEDRRRTCQRRMIILVPMKHEALLFDNDFSVNDKSITRENKLNGIDGQGGRQYGQTQVYTIQHEGHRYRVAMEEATPIRTAACAVDDSARVFDKEDFEEFARRFQTALQKILCSKPGIRDQVELVPIEDMRKVGSTVVQRILKLEELKEGSADQRQELAGRLTAAGSVAAGQLEQQGAS